MRKLYHRAQALARSHTFHHVHHALYIGYYVFVAIDDHGVKACVCGAFIAVLAVNALLERE